MFEAFLGAAFGVWSTYAVVILKEKLDERNERKYRERVRREQLG